MKILFGYSARSRLGRVALWAAAAPIVCAQPMDTPPPAIVSRAESTPRKVVVATILARFTGDLASRAAQAGTLLDQAAGDAQRTYQRPPDLVVLPEYALSTEHVDDASTRAVALDDPALEILWTKVRAHRAWVVAPMMLREGKRLSNAALLVNREGAVAGTYRKVHPVVDGTGRLEGGVTPGTDYGVFDCDFGRLGILICWDMAYPEAWAALAARGAELVALPSASPQTLRPMAQALRHQFYVITSTPRNNVSLFDPMGATLAQSTQPGPLVHELDLAYAVLHFSPRLKDGRVLRERFGDRVGFRYSAREDTGLFWSNDPELSIGAMIREFGLREMPAWIEETRVQQNSAREAKR